MAVRRALTFLTYTKRNNAAIGGAMLYAEHPHLQYEQGAELSSYGVRSINQNYDLEHIQPVVENELAAPPAFGPWWFFLFPLQAMRTLPFPFFVRGDDVAFSLQNNFDILALPSAAAWQPSFEYKISASTEYLATRSFLMLPLVVEGKHWNCSETLEGFKKQFTLEVDAYRYPIAEAMLSALEDAMMGPSFWERESNTLARLGRLKALQAQTTQRARLDYPSPTDENKVGRLFGRLWYKLQRTLPVMAYLKFRKPGISYNMWPQPVEAAGRRGMVYASRDGKNRLACRFDARWMRSLRKRGAELMIRYETTFDANREIYDAARESLQGLEAWTKKFQ
jgi:hypothetical protein